LSQNDFELLRSSIEPRRTVT